MKDVVDTHINFYTHTNNNLSFIGLRYLTHSVPCFTHIQCSVYNFTTQCIKVGFLQVRIHVDKKRPQYNMPLIIWKNMWSGIILIQIVQERSDSFLNKRAQRALGPSPEEKVNGHSGAIYRGPQMLSAKYW